MQPHSQVKPCQQQLIQSNVRSIDVVVVFVQISENKMPGPTTKKKMPTIALIRWLISTQFMLHAYKILCRFTLCAVIYVYIADSKYCFFFFTFKASQLVWGLLHTHIAFSAFTPIEQQKNEMLNVTHSQTHAHNTNTKSHRFMHTNPINICI